MILAEYDPVWPAMFAALRDRIVPVLGSGCIAVHHVGSTAIPGIVAKPIIDMIVEIRDYSSFDTVSAALAGLGYICEGDLGVKDRIAFKCKDITVPYGETEREWIHHHLYVCPRFSEEMKRHIAFRDYLIRHEDARDEYACIKKRIESESSGDRKTYVKMKQEQARAFVERILDQARAEEARRNC